MIRVSPRLQYEPIHAWIQFDSYTVGLSFLFACKMTTPEVTVLSGSQSTVNLEVASVLCEADFDVEVDIVLS